MMRTVVLALACSVAALACGGRPPPPARGVMEKDVGGWKFRRYQQVLDIEVWVADNAAVAHTASYVRGNAEKEGRLVDGDVVNAFVTRYETGKGVLRALVKFARRLAQESGYRVNEARVGSVRVFEITGNGEAWALWASDAHVVKIGGRGVESIPGKLVSAYAKPYPSRLGIGMLEGPLPPGEDAMPQDERLKTGPKDEPYDPDNPAPDWDNYDPDEARTPKGERKK